MSSVAKMKPYLAVASEPLASLATVLADTGIRPEECFWLRWESVNIAKWTEGRVAYNSWKERLSTQGIVDDSPVGLDGSYAMGLTSNPIAHAAST